MIGFAAGQRRPGGRSRVVSLTPDETKDLAQNDPELLAEAQREESRELELLWPEPDENDVRLFYDRMKKVWGGHKALMALHRKVRYLRDETPEKWRRHLEDRQRIHTRLSHNEVLRVGANQARNPYKVECRAAGTEPKAVKRAKKQTRWASEFWPAMERASLFPLRRRFVDSQIGDGMAVYEVYVTHRYDAVNTDERDVEEPGKDGAPGSVRKETPKEYLQRTEQEILELGECAEIGVRWVDAMAVFPEPDEGDRVSPASHGIGRVVIAERKMYRDVYRGLLKRKGRKAVEELQLPAVGSMGWPANYETWGVLTGTETAAADGSVGIVPNDAAGEVEHLRYYDPVWYVEIVGGKVVTCEKHGMPGVPVFVGWCIVTGSSFLSEALEGITWGMLDIELAANDLLTYKVDSTITFGRPAPVIETPQGGNRMEGKDHKPVELDLSDVTKVKQLAPGQTVADAFEGFRTRIQDSDISALLGLWQQNGLNPIAQGQSPGASPAGYTVNSLMGASLAPYDQPIENEEKIAGQVIDFVRLMIRDTIKERLYLAVPMEDKKVGGTEWLGLGPEDVDETPCRVTIDPLSDANRMAMRESLHAGRVAGYISRSRVQREGYNVEDTEAEDLEIIEDSAMEKLAAVLLENVFQRVRIAPAMPPPGPGNMKGQKDASGGAADDAAMADPKPPTVGAELAASSQLTAGGDAGQGNGYQPPAGPLNRTA